MYFLNMFRSMSVLNTCARCVVSWWRRSAESKMGNVIKFSLSSSSFAPAPIPQQRIGIPPLNTLVLILVQTGTKNWDPRRRKRNLQKSCKSQLNILALVLFWFPLSCSPDLSCCRLLLMKACFPKSFLLFRFLLCPLCFDLRILPKCCSSLPSLSTYFPASIFCICAPDMFLFAFCWCFSGCSWYIWARPSKVQTALAPCKHAFSTHSHGSRHLPLLWQMENPKFWPETGPNYLSNMKTKHVGITICVW